QGPEGRARRRGGQAHDSGGTALRSLGSTIDSQVVSLKTLGADIFFDEASPKFAAQAIRKAAEIGWRPTLFLASVSNSVGSVLKPAGLENSRGVLSSNYIKDPTDPAWKDDPEIREWAAFMDKYFPEGGKT